MSFLQINLHCMKAAQDLLHQTIAELAIDWALISEYHS